MSWDQELQRAIAAKAQQEAAIRHQRQAAEEQRRKVDTDQQTQAARKLTMFESNVGALQAFHALNRLPFWGGRGTVEAYGNWYSITARYLESAKPQLTDVWGKRHGKYPVYHASLSGVHLDHYERGEHEAYEGTKVTGVLRNEVSAQIRIQVYYTLANDSYYVEETYFPAANADWSKIKTHIAALLTQRTDELARNGTIAQIEQRALAEERHIQGQIGTWAQPQMEIGTTRKSKDNNRWLV